MSKVAARTVQTPGEAPPQDQPKPDAYTANVIQTGQENEPGDESDAAEPSDVDRLVLLVQAQQAQIEALTGAVQNIARGQGSGSTPAQTASSLPDQSEIDVSKLQTPVLTRQGWIVPPDFGTPAEFKQEQKDRETMRAAMQKIANAV